MTYNTVKIPVEIRPAAYFVVGFPREEQKNFEWRVWGPLTYDAENPLHDIAAIRRRFGAEYDLTVYATVEVPEEHYAEGDADRSNLFDLDTLSTKGMPKQ